MYKHDPLIALLLGEKIDNQTDSGIPVHHNNCI